MEDERLATIKQEQQAALESSKGTYDQMLQDNENLLNQQKDYVEQYEKTQNEALDKQLALYQENINKQKEAAQKNYETEARKAANSYMAYTNPYGVNAETFASKGQLQSGLTQTAQLGGYNAYQNRLASANKVMQEAFTQYDLDMNEAIVNNDVQKAQNALAKLEMMLGYNETYINNKNSIAQSQLTNQQQLDSEYYGRYMDMINQINTEKQREEAIRQFEAQMAYQRERDAVADNQWQQEYNLARTKAVSGGSGGGGGNAPALTDQVSTKYWSGPINSDVQYGTFSATDNNGVRYQPDNIGGTKLKSVNYSGQTLTIVNNGVTQKVWTTGGDNYYYWEGRDNEYKALDKSVVAAAKKEIADNIKANKKKADASK